MTILGIRTLALGMLMLIVAGCSSAGIPTNQSASTSIGTSARVHQATACPDTGITLGSGDHPTYSVAINDSCVMYGPGDQSCALNFQDGLKYLFVIGSGDSYGTLSGTTQSGGASKATFKRTSGPGDVVIDLKQSFSPQVSCHEQGYAPFASVTFN
jgi:hypothetical protein